VHCGAGKWCNTSGGDGSRCENVVSAGQTLPGNTTCTPELAQRACESKVCSASNNQCVECTVDSDCKTTGQVCSSFVCKAATMPPADVFSFAGGGFGCSCNLGSHAASSASSFGAAACLALLALRTWRRRRQDRGSAN
jgi:MYXO-CTERM domain-containing protein